MSKFAYTHIEGGTMVVILKALSDENRLRLLNLIRFGSICVCELEYVLELAQSNVSRHLAKLKQAGIITSSKHSQWVHYEVDPDFLKAYPEMMCVLEKAFTDTVYQKDIEAYGKFKKSGMTCKDIVL